MTNTNIHFLLHHTRVSLPCNQTFQCFQVLDWFQADTNTMSDFYIYMACMLQTAAIKMTFSVFCPTITALIWVKFGRSSVDRSIVHYARPNLRSLIFFRLFAPQGRLPPPIFLKFTGFMCSYSPHIRDLVHKSGIYNQKTARSFLPEIPGTTSPKTGDQIPKQLPTEKMVRTSSIHVPSLVEIGLCTTTQEQKCVFFVCLSCLAWPVLVSQICRDVQHFNEVQLHH